MSGYGRYLLFVSFKNSILIPDIQILFGFDKTKVATRPLAVSHPKFPHGKQQVDSSESVNWHYRLIADLNQILWNNPIYKSSILVVGQSSNAIWKLFFMTYNRLEAKVIPGEHCRFCGEEFWLFPISWGAHYI